MAVIDTIIIAIREAFRSRRRAKMPLQTAARLRRKYGVILSKEAKTPLPRSVFDEMWGESLMLNRIAFEVVSV
jgi:antitoxin VapB